MCVEFMGSPVLGPVRMVKGGAETTQTGRRLQGTKDIVGGALDTTTIPGAFLAPEAGEAAGQAGDAVLAQAGRAANAARSTVSVKALQPRLQGGSNARTVLPIQRRAGGHLLLPTVKRREACKGRSDSRRLRRKDGSAKGIGAKEAHGTRDRQSDTSELRATHQLIRQQSRGGAWNQARLVRAYLIRGEQGRGFGLALDCQSPCE